MPPRPLASAVVLGALLGAPGHGWCAGHAALDAAFLASFGQPRIRPPTRPGSLFSLRYDGWVMAPGTASPKAPLHLLTSYEPHGASLAMHPVVPVPTCGR